MIETLPWPIRRSRGMAAVVESRGIFSGRPLCWKTRPPSARDCCWRPEQISWPAAFTACFLGIWLGDAGLYALARFAGRGWFERSSLRKFSAKVARSENWFAERGTLDFDFQPRRSRRAAADVSCRRIFARAAAAFLVRHRRGGVRLDLHHSVSGPNLRRANPDMAGRTTNPAACDCCWARDWFCSSLFQ